MSDEENKKQISQFSKKDAEKFGEYETQLQRFVDAIDHLLDHSPLKIHPVSSPFGLVMRLNIEIKLGMIYFIYLSSINLILVPTSSTVLLIFIDECISDTSNFYLN